MLYFKGHRILFGAKHKLAEAGSPVIRYGTMHIKQYHTMKYLGCSSDKSFSGESMAVQMINKLNSRLRFIYKKIIKLI